MKIYVPMDSAAKALGAEDVVAALRAAAPDARIIRTGTRGMIWLEPLIEVEVDGVRHGFGPAEPGDVAGILDGSSPKALGPVEDLDWMQRQTRLTFARVGVIDPLSLADYEGHGGLAGLRRALAMTGQQIVDEVKASGLRGRGGAGFPTGIKWQTVHDADAPQKYIVCNADEGDSGTFADRMVMEGDPFTLIEGMAIAGLGVGATRGYVYLRSEYPDAIAVMRRAVAIARAAGVLGPDVLGSGRAFDMEIRVGAGAYVCGEETSLLNSLEGKRGVVRAKPPLPALEGFLGRPTVVNNVISLATVPVIFERGAAFYAISGWAGRAARSPCRLPGMSRAAGCLKPPSASPWARLSMTLAAAPQPATRSKPCRWAGRLALTCPCRNSARSWATRNLIQRAVCWAMPGWWCSTTAPTCWAWRGLRWNSAPWSPAANARPAA